MVLHGDSFSQILRSATANARRLSRGSFRFSLTDKRASDDLLLHSQSIARVDAQRHEMNARVRHSEKPNDPPGMPTGFHHS